MRVFDTTRRENEGGEGYAFGRRHRRIGVG
jgi:hypothetical protein